MTPTSKRLALWIGSLAMLCGVGAAPARAEVIANMVEWTADGVTFEGTLVFDDVQLAAKNGKLPGVLVVHQWMGPSDYEFMRARMLAELGYVAFVADVYGVKVRPTDGKQAGAAAGGLKGDRAELRKRMRANLERMMAQPQVDVGRLAAIGYCFGGTAVLELARSGANIDGVVSFHGGLDSPAPKDGMNITAKVLVLHGAADPFVKKEDLDAFIAELDAARVDWQRVDYARAVHAFTQKEAGDDPTKGAAYDERADRRSWEHMKTFLAEVLK